MAEMTIRKIVECDAFTEYKELFSIRPPDLQRKKYDDELQQLQPEDGLIEFLYHEMEIIEAGSPPVSYDEFNGVNKYLWVITEETVPLILENGETGQKLTRNSVSHTNLTGGKDAYCGGEVWFDGSSNVIWISGGSSRYRARNKDELDKIAEWFSNCNYEVVNFGWDEDIDGPVRLFRGRSR
ncbi:hypothetical protein [Paenibacillus humicola]|uniref:hypothetical protein n=1 Tax=Paenibacillus humicola TaxID=3110540 RepID=UPI00237C193B|nr:hypothetical protein [Paenibacillus humicola]